MAAQKRTSVRAQRTGTVTQEEGGSVDVLARQGDLRQSHGDGRAERGCIGLNDAPARTELPPAGEEGVAGGVVPPAPTLIDLTVDAVPSAASASPEPAPTGDGTPPKGRAATPRAPRAPDEQWQVVGGGLGFELVCDCLSPRFRVLLGDDDALSMQCTSCRGVAMVVTLWEEEAQPAVAS